MKLNIKKLRKKDLRSKLNDLQMDLMKNNAQRATGTQSKGSIKQIKKAL